MPPHLAHVLALQRNAGNAAVTRLIARQATPGVTTAPVRPTFTRGDLDKLVGVAQQKLDVLGASPELAIDGEFGSRTVRAVVHFQRANGLTPSGDLDDATWARLDALAQGGAVAPDGSLTPVPGLRPADPSISGPAGVSTHPVLKLGSTGAAVSELHEKLNAAGFGGPGLPVGSGLTGAGSIAFEAATDSAVRAFQAARKLGVDGKAGRDTWAALDRLVPGAGAGRIDQREAPDRARGETFNSPITADWALEPNRAAPTRLAVRVRYAYVNDAARPVNQAAEVARILSGIRSVWNVFKAVESPLPPAPARPPVALDFEPVEGTPADHTITLSSGVGPTNAGHYFFDGTSAVTETAAHEFGHDIGLPDEYQQSAADHLTETGRAAPVGTVTGDANPRDIAVEMGTALRSAPRAERGGKALAVVQGHGLQQGAFAQRVALRYRLVFGADVVADCTQRIDEPESEGSLTKRRLCTQPFLYTEDNLMGGAETEKGPNALLVEPRHVRRYAGIVASALGGIWEPAPR